MAERLHYFGIEKLNDANYSSWTLVMKMYLQREELWDVVDEVTADANRDDAWKKLNVKALSTIVLCVDKSQHNLVRNVTVAKTAWDNLQKYHEKNTIISKVTILKRLCTKRLTEDGSVAAHLNAMDELFERTDSLELELPAVLKVALVLASLPDSYDNLVIALEGRKDDELTMEFIRSKLLDESLKRSEKLVPVEPSDTVLKTNFKPKVCYFCQKPGHIKKQCRKFLAQRRNDQARKANASTKEEVLFMAGDEECEESNWYVDSGATRHMSSDKQFFTSLKLDDTVTVQLADGTSTCSKGRGNGRLTCVATER